MVDTHDDDRLFTMLNPQAYLAESVMLDKVFILPYP